MVGIINADKDQTLKEYKDKASKLASGVSPGHKAYGGKVSKDSSSDSKSKDDKKGSGSMLALGQAYGLSVVLGTMFVGFALL